MTHLSEDSNRERQPLKDRDEHIDAIKAEHRRKITRLNHDVAYQLKASLHSLITGQLKQMMPIRTEPIGLDRARSRYYIFAGEPSSVFVHSGLADPLSYMVLFEFMHGVIIRPARLGAAVLPPAVRRAPGTPERQGANIPRCYI